MKIKYPASQCPHCGRPISISVSGDCNSGSPLQAYAHCGKFYPDKSFHEIEIDGIRESDLSIKRSGGRLVGSLLAVAISFLQSIFLKKVILCVSKPCGCVI